MPKVHLLLDELRREMKRAADPERAAGQQAYMKSTMPYHGLRNDETRAICRRVFASYDVEAGGGRRWHEDILAIWRGAERREERYAAIELAQLRKARPLHTLAALPMFEELIVTGAWWDYVDTLASKNLSLVLRNDATSMGREMLAWSKSDDLWKRRSAILCQLPLKGETDLNLLFACIEPALDSKEFFLRKAIGWALREYAWTDPREVARYVRANETRLSPLSRREALKNSGTEHAGVGRGAATSFPARGAKRRNA
jgi:3-methyladenine DNA glycosylase AlkD